MNIESVKCIVNSQPTNSSAEFKNFYMESIKCKGYYQTQIPKIQSNYSNPQIQFRLAIA